MYLPVRAHEVFGVRFAVKPATMAGQEKNDFALLNFGGIGTCHLMLTIFIAGKQSSG
jgi:hypothetical protein